jgi:hypothetical protein
MTKKRMALIAVLPLSIAMIIGVLAMPTGPGVTKANLDRVEEGMTKAEVEQIFGMKGEKLPPAYDGEWMYWRADDGSSAVIRFGEDGLDFKNWHDSDETIPDKIRRWLHLPKGT